MWAQSIERRQKLKERFLKHDLKTEAARVLARHPGCVELHFKSHAAFLALTSEQKNRQRASGILMGWPCS